MRSITTISLPESTILKMNPTLEKRKIINFSAYITGLIEKDIVAYEQSKIELDSEMKKTNSLNQQIHDILKLDPRLKEEGLEAQMKGSDAWSAFKWRIIKERGLKP